MSSVLSKYLSLRSPLLYIGLALAISLGASSYAWFDHLTAQGDTVAGNVEFAGERMDGKSEGEVRAFVAIRADQVLSSSLAIDTPLGEIAVALRDIGFDYDTELAIDRLMAARHTGGPVDQFTTWVATMGSTMTVQEPIAFDPDAAATALAAMPDLTFSDPVEPGMMINDEWRLELIPGEPGSEADFESMVSQLADLDPLTDELTLEAPASVLPTQVTDVEAQARIDDLNEVTSSGVRLTIGGVIRQMAPAAIRRNLRLAVEPAGMEVSFDLEGFQQEIEEVFRGPIGEEVDPTFEVSGEEVTVLEPGTPPQVCCSTDTAEKIGSAILDGRAGPFALTTRPQDDPEVIAWYDGSLIVEQVSTFTTPHSCCENRVINIQRMADIVRGYYMAPGEVLSLNDYVGPRTREKGFVAAGAIRAGHLTPEVGGGVSQFATTIFNAAYFAGLDFLEYQAHSLYFSRYPYGREATISNPAPDLVFENTTEYPVLIWTSYTPTSITVSMYSTKSIDVEQVATRSSRRGQCTYVETDRERVYSDGTSVIDTFFALYRPADGIDCNGNPIPQ
ncbi:MAG: hypothetical protein DWQ40_01080 [Actinobacteria bacterium]|nr:MAG: hypothetical protein DWQ40_01080 [Actinomycetota bacterium]